jgi:hypothetical protein
MALFLCFSFALESLHLDLSGWGKIGSVFLLYFAALFATYAIAAVLEGAILAWRWLLSTAAIFGALVVINEFYVRCLKKTVESLDIGKISQ